MKTKNTFLHAVAAMAVVFSGATIARAGIYTWSAPAAITTADATLNQTGTIVGAACFGVEEEIVTLANGTVLDFKTDGSVADASGLGTGYGAFTNTTGNANFDTVLTQFNDDGGPKTITLNNLTVGQQYSVQLFALDNRSGIDSTLVANYQDPNDPSDISANFQMGQNVFVIGTFTANATSVNIQENLLNSDNGNINALVIRQLTGLPVAPQITTEPQADTIYNGQSANISVAATGTAPLTYQWQKSNVGGTSFTNLSNGSRISGATNDSLTISNLASTDTGDYQVVVSNAAGSVTSSPAATLNVLAGTPQFAWSAPAAITTADATLNQSGTIVGAATFGSTAYTVTLTNNSVINFTADGSVAVVTSGGYGPSTGAFAGDTGNAEFNSVLDEYNFDAGPKIITLYGLFVGQQYSVQLFALDDRSTAGDGSYPFRLAYYQDPNDQFDVSSTFAMGANDYLIGTFTASNTQVNIQQDLLTGGLGNINALVVRALGVIVAPQITSEPQSVTVDEGLTTTFTVAASGTTPLTYIWQKSNVGGSSFTNVANGSRISGAATTELIIANLVPGDTGDYRVIVANAAGSVTSTPPATLTVQASPPQFVWSVPAAITTADTTLAQAGTIVGAAVFGTTPTIVVLTNGDSVDFSTNATVATATGAGTTTGAFSGETGNPAFDSVLNQFNYDNGPKTITLNNLVAGQQYAVQLFGLDDRTGGANSRQANFQDPNDPYDYSATFLMGANDYTIATFTAAGTTASIQENLFTSSSGNINALVLRRLTGLPLAPQITTQPLPVSVFAGATVQFTVGANGTSLSYQWQRAVTGSGNFHNVVNGGNTSGVNTAQLTLVNVEDTSAADYRVVISNAAGSLTSSPAATLTIRPPATLIHRWSFNETSGTTAHDSVGGADGTLQGNATFSNGYVDLPNGNQSTASAYVSIPGGLVTGLSAVTFETWYTNGGLNNGNTLIGFGGLIDSDGAGTNFICFFARWPFSQNGFQIDTEEGNSGVVLLGTREQNGYFHWDMSYDPIAGNVQLYLNGSFVASAGGVYVPLSDVATNLGYIGYSVWNQVIGYAIPGTSGNNPFLNANIDEMRIYNGVLSPNAIAATQLLGANQVLSTNAMLSASKSAGNLVLTWPLANGSFTLESSPTLGSGAVWSQVPGTLSVVGSNYQTTVPTTNTAALFFRLRE